VCYVDRLDTGAKIDDVILFSRRNPRGTAEFMHAALRGVVTGVRRVVFAGYNPEVDVATVPEDVWFGGGLIPRPSGNESWEIVSSSADDSAAGTGARAVSITTLDTNYVETIQTVSLNGLTPVAIPGNCRFANACVVTTAGSLGSVQGDLTIRVSGGGATRAIVPAVDGLLCQAKYTVPAGHTLDLHSLFIAVRAQGGTESALFSIVVTNSAGRSLSPVRFPLFVAGVNAYRHEVSGGTVPFNRIAEKNEVQVRGVTVTQNNTTMDAAFLALLYDNTYWP